MRAILASLQAQLSSFIRPARFRPQTNTLQKRMGGLSMLVLLAFASNALAQTEAVITVITVISPECDPNVFHTDFAMATDSTQGELWVRNMGGERGRMIAAPGWYDASVNTLLKTPDQACARGPYATPTPPYNMDAQSTFQLTGARAGVLMLSRDSQFRNPHAFYGIQEFSETYHPWLNPTDAFELEADLRMSMLNANHVPGSTQPIGQLYVAFNVIDRVSGKVIEFGIAAYDSRSSSDWLACDGAGTDGENAIFASTFSNDATGCPRRKTFEIPLSSATFVYGGDWLDNGAWFEPRIFQARLTRDGLLAAIIEANGAIGGFSYDPADYTLSALGLIQEIIWTDPNDGIDMASQFGDLRATIVGNPRTPLDGQRGVLPIRFPSQSQKMSPLNDNHRGGLMRDTLLRRP